MYLRPSNKWNEFLLAESSQPAVLLTEITYASAVNNLGSKKMRKVVARWLDRELPSWKFLMRSPPEREEIIDTYMPTLKKWLLEIVPDDLEDNQKGLAITWLARLARDLETGYMSDFFGAAEPGRGTSAAWEDFEMFFHYQQFMAEKDLNRIKDLDELEQIVLDARGAIRDYQEARAYKDAGAEGAQEVFLDDENWKIVAIHNKGAACELGKKTAWCTAAPGLNYFETYYKPEDPLFYFEQKSDEKPGAPGAKFQAHYGSKQFNDKDDRPLSHHWRMKLHNLLMQTEAPEKYPILRKQDRKFKLADQSTSAEELAELADSREAEYLELTTIAMHPNVSPETLLKLASVSARTKDYIGGEGWNTYATTLKDQVARNPNATSEALDVVWEESLKDYNTMKESAAKLLLAKKRVDDLSDEWLEGAIDRRSIAIYNHWGAIWQRITANDNVSDELLNTIAETDFGEDLGKLPKAMAREKQASRKAGEEGIGYVDLRSRLIRRRSSRTSQALPPLAEQRIIQRWHKIFK